MTDERYDAIKGFHIYNPSKVLLYMRELEEEEPVFLEVHPSTACNYRCIWCRYWGMSKKNNLKKKELFSLFTRYPKVRGIRISGGGEPLINNHLMAFLLECKKREIKVGIDTNGSLLNLKSINIIGETCQYCRISLDAATPQTYKKVHGKNLFHKVISNIKKLSSSGIPELGVSYLVTKHNYKEISKLADLNLPVDYIHFKPLIEGIDPKIKEKALVEIKKLKGNTPILIKYDRILKDYYFNRAVNCEVTKIIRVIGGDNKEYVCCEHAYEPDFEVGKWDGSTSKCTQCRYNPYNEVIDMYKKNTFTKEFL